LKPKQLCLLKPANSSKQDINNDHQFPNKALPAPPHAIDLMGTFPAEQ